MPGLSVPATTRRQFFKKFKKAQRQKIRHQTELDACKRDAVRIGRKDGAAVDTPKKKERDPHSFPSQILVDSSAGPRLKRRASQPHPR
jgi:hypothetical protein